MANLTIKARLYVILAAAVSGFMLLGLGSLYQIEQIHGKVKEDYSSFESGMHTLVLIQSANIAFKTQVQEWKNILLRGNDAANFEKYSQGFSASESLVGTKLTQALEALRAVGSPFARDIENLLSEHREMGKKYRSALAQFDQADPEAGKKTDALVKGMDRSTTDSINKLVEAFETGQHDRLNRQIQSSQDEFRQIRNTQLAIFAALLVICGSLVLFTALHIARQVADFQQVISGISANRNLTLRMPAAGDDEISAIGKSFNDLLQVWQNAIGQIKRSADSVASYARDMTASVAELSYSVGAQKAATTEMAAAIEEMTASIAHISDSSQNANTISSTSSRQSADGSSVIEKTVSAMQNTSNGVMETAKVVERVGQQSQEISGIVQTIKDVADQTNLLALNAAIEAARAGEQGRGFAVVADEVRTLAEKTTRMTENITQLVDRIQASAQDAVVNIGKVVQGVDQNVALAHQAGEAIGGIREGSIRVVDATNTIATALAEQSVVSESIASKVAAIELMSNKNNDSLARLKDAAGRMDTLAGDMRAMASQFKA
ncbi:methyl-accepting chemotaxis protein [Methylomonas sp. MED-D]|uniref:methyl-accepting chemotaxis protein n=1 Tax=unclassified Methylomonas TaxID=2608980 RepID=UPI0024794EF6|nr:MULTISPECIES: methyl-accepting chemotaxis protein [unclassified Methylomonas]MDT4332095.1 methyl-accepting chemotaxis protein [Methylomonas sp. MV1]WGS85732.1 methyl-accepting chemotaxis protein [Methylomonas sp. UP202]